MMVDPPLTCKAEAQHSQGCAHMHTHARADGSVQHLPVRQLTAGLSVVEGCPAPACGEKEIRPLSAKVLPRPFLLSSPGLAWKKATTAPTHKTPGCGSLVRC